MCTYMYICVYMYTLVYIGYMYLNIFGGYPEQIKRKSQTDFY